MVRFVELMRDIKEGLGRDAPHIETGSSEGPSLLDADSAETQLGSLDGGDVT